MAAKRKSSTPAKRTRAASGATARRSAAPTRRDGTARGAAAGRTLPRTKDLERVYVRDRAGLRRWLEANHATSPGMWLIFDKKSAGRGRLPYGDAVEEALCFGWIDSLAQSIDAERYEQLFTPRKPRSTWSRSNKERVERLAAAGLLHPAGIAAIELAKQNGSWTTLDVVDALTIPEDLAAALARNATARRHFEAFPPSARRAYLYWVLSAKRPETRARRVKAVVELARQNRKTPQD